MILDTQSFWAMMILAGIPHRVVMELMRHSDPRLTTKTYTDAGQLPVGAAVLSLPSLAVSEKTDSQIDSQKLVAGSLSLSSAVPQKEIVDPDGTHVNKGESLELTVAVPPCPIFDNGASDGFKPCTAHHPKHTVLPAICLYFQAILAFRALRVRIDYSLQYIIQKWRS